MNNMKNTKTPIGIEEIQKIKMTLEEKERILGNVLSSPIQITKPIKSPYSFISIFQKNQFAYFGVILLLLVVLGGGNLAVNYFQNQNTEIARINTGGMNAFPTNTNNFNNTNTTPTTNGTQKNKNTSSSPSLPSSPLAKNTNKNTNNGSISSSGPTATMTAPTTENQAAPITLGLKKAFELYKNGQISECILNGQIYYSAMLNAYDGGGQTFDVSGKAVGQYQGFTGAYTGIQPQNCELIYVSYPNIWGLEALNKYNLK
jgi:hypothetical protein